MLWTVPDSGMPSFAQLGLPAPIVSALRRAGITEPFPIQAATLPDSLAGRDLLGRGQTGSGKTLAFGLALLARLAGGRARAAGSRAGWSSSRPGSWPSRSSTRSPRSPRPSA